MLDAPKNSTDPAFLSLPGAPELIDTSARRNNIRDWLLLGGGCFLMAAALRFVRIGYGEFFGSEFRTLDILAGQRDPHFFSALLRGNLSLYYLLLSIWAHFSGVASEILLRIPSALIGLLAWLGFFAFARSYLRGTAFLICILVFALNPVLVDTSNDATPFALLALCTVLSHLMCLRALDKGGKANWTGYTAATLAGVLTHPLFWFVLPAQFVFAVLRRRRTPEPFRAICTAGLALTPLVLAGLILYRYYNFPKIAPGQAPPMSDLIRSVVAVVVGNFPRFGATEFVRALMYTYIIVCLALSYVYYRKRTAEAMAMPENVVWIDETQDVVGTWKRLSLRAFLLYQWFTFLVPTVGILILAAVMPTVHLSPEIFIVALPSLIVLIAMGIDAAPKNAIVSLGLLLVLSMINYDVKTLSDRGYGIKEAFRHIRDDVKFDPAKDVLIYTSPKHIQRAVEHYRGNLPTAEIQSAETLDEFAARQKQLQTILDNHDRAVVIYNDDMRQIGKTENRSPVREWLKPRNGFELEHKWDWAPNEFNPAPERTELRVYNRRPPAPPNSPESQ